MKTNGGNRIQEARMVMHEDEHAIIKAMVRKAIGDDACFEMVVSGGRSQSGRAEDRLVLARFLERMERQFDLRANGHQRIRAIDDRGPFRTTGEYASQQLSE